MKDPYKIKNVQELREVIGRPHALTTEKVFDHIEEQALTFIAHSPLLLLSTADAQGNLDVSPKGDAPGFVIAEDEKTLLLPDRPGNKLVFGFQNILETGKVGLIFLVPGVRETLRINGTAEITNDPHLLNRLSAKGKPALLCIRINVQECFLHCGKALIRSNLWDSSTWPQGVKPSFAEQFAKKLNWNQTQIKETEEHIEAGYKTNLY